MPVYNFCCTTVPQTIVLVQKEVTTAFRSYNHKTAVPRIDIKIHCWQLKPNIIIVSVCHFRWLAISILVLFTMAVAAGPSKKHWTVTLHQGLGAPPIQLQVRKKSSIADMKWVMEDQVREYWDVWGYEIKN